MIESGTTTYADMYYFEDEIARETKAAGLRGVLGQTVIQFPVADAKTPSEGLARAERFIQAFKNDPLITPAVAPHAIYTNDSATLKAAREMSVRLGVPTLIHVAETQSEAMTAKERGSSTVVSYLDSLGFLGPGVLAAHAVWVNESDMALLKSRGVGVSHNPVSNMKLASGIAPVKRTWQQMWRSVWAQMVPPATTIWICSRRCGPLRSCRKSRRRIRPPSARAPPFGWRRSAVRGRSGWTNRLVRSNRANVPTSSSSA
jgi:cytosine/adenosine deaminase-related metal-dependent hydrolase